MISENLNFYLIIALTITLALIFDLAVNTFLNIYKIVKDPKTLSVQIDVIDDFKQNSINLVIERDISRKGSDHSRKRKHSPDSSRFYSPNSSRIKYSPSSSKSLKDDSNDD